MLSLLLYELTCFRYIASQLQNWLESWGLGHTAETAQAEPKHISASCLADRMQTISSDRQPQNTCIDVRIADTS